MDGDNTSSEQTKLATCLEWSLLHSIGAGAKQSLLRSTCSPFSSKEPEAGSAWHIRNDIAFLEADLRHLLYQYDFLSSHLFHRKRLDELQGNLKRLCHQLDQFVNPSLLPASSTQSGRPASSASSREQDHDESLHESRNNNYCSLRALIGSWYQIRLADASHAVLNLVTIATASSCGPAIFLVPERNVRETLGVIDSCNKSLDALGRFLGESDQPQPSSAQSTGSLFGDRAKLVLRSLFNHFCTQNEVHDVRLSLPDRFASSGPGPVLEMLLPGCSSPENLEWHVAQCLPYRDDLGQMYQAIKIDDLCCELDDHKRDQDSILTLFSEHHGLFNGIHQFPGVSKSHLDPKSLQSLDELIREGAFLRTSQALFTARQKCIFALKLAHCLAEFIFPDSCSPKWNNKDGIFMISNSKAGEFDKSRLYLTFARTAHREKSDELSTELSKLTLFAFARIILEIYTGKSIELDENNPDKQVATLMVCLCDAQKQEDGDYAKAVLGAISFFNCTWDLNPYPGESRLDVVRRTIRQKIVTPFNEAVLLSQKRRREESDGSLADTSKRQRVAASSSPSIKDRFNVLRAQEVRTPDNTTVSDVVTQIIENTIPVNDRNKCRFVVHDLTPSTLELPAHGAKQRGHAMIYFYGQLPDGLKKLTQKGTKSIKLPSEGSKDCSMEADAKFLGITELSAPCTPVQADIVLIHGLNGHPCGSWLDKSADPVLWPFEFLRQDFPNCRIMLYGYDSNIFDERMHLKHELVPQAERLSSSLNNVRNTKESRKRPIIFIAHSYGGLVLARALCDAYAAFQKHKTQLLDATAAILLMACPFRGFHVADVRSVLRSGQQPNNDDWSYDNVDRLLQSLGNGDFLRTELSNFENAVKSRKIRLFTFYEMGRTASLTSSSGKPRRDGEPVLSAPPNSVILDYEEEVIPATDKDHSNIVKLSFQSDQTYKDIVYRIGGALEGLQATSG